MLRLLTAFVIIAAFITIIALMAREVSASSDSSDRRCERWRIIPGKVMVPYCAEWADDRP